MPMKSAGDTPKTPPKFWIMYLFLSVFIIIGSGCLLYAPVKLVKTALFIKSAAATTGTVTDLIASRSSKSTTYAPVVTFTAPDGRRVEFRSQISSGSSAYRIGEEVAVYYDPLRPERAEIKAFTPLWMPTIILSAIGLAFTGMGGGVIVAMRRARREAQEQEAAQLQGMKDWGSYQWLLRLSADLPGIDLDRNFLIPVVATETPLTSTLSTPLAPSLAPAEAIPAHIVRIEQEADHLLFRYPCRRNLKSALITALVGGFFLLFCYLFSVKVAGVGGFLLPIFGLIGLALVLSSLWLFAYSLQVDAAAGEVVVVRRFFGLPLRTVLIPASALRAIETQRRGVLGSGNTAKLIFTVVARCVDGTKITIGDGIAGRGLAESIARMIAQKYGLGVPKAALVRPLSREIL